MHFCLHYHESRWIADLWSSVYYILWSTKYCKSLSPMDTHWRHCLLHLLWIIVFRMDLHNFSLGMHHEKLYKSIPWVTIFPFIGKPCWNVHIHRSSNQDGCWLYILEVTISHVWEPTTVSCSTLVIRVYKINLVWNVLNVIYIPKPSSSWLQPTYTIHTARYSDWSSYITAQPQQGASCCYEGTLPSCWPPGTPAGVLRVLCASIYWVGGFCTV